MERQELIEKKAQRLRESLGFEGCLKITYDELKEKFLSMYKNIEIREDIDKKGVSIDSAVTVTDEVFVIHVNNSIWSPSDKKVSLLMGIYYLDEVCSKATGTKEAIKFAVSFLVPELLLLRKILKEEPEIEELSEDFDLSKDLIISRLETLEII